MKVHFFATLRPLAGGKTVEFAAQDGITVRELLDNIVSRFPAMRKRLLNDEGHLYEHVHVFINGRDVHLLENELETAIHPKDEINIFPAIGGGCQWGRRKPVLSRQQLDCQSRGPGEIWRSTARTI